MPEPAPAAPISGSPMLREDIEQYVRYDLTGDPGAHSPRTNRYTIMFDELAAAQIAAALALAS